MSTSKLIKTGMFAEYINYHNEYTKRFGDHVIVLYQNGHFFEILASEDEGPNMEEVTGLLNIVLTKRPSKNPNAIVPKMAGVQKDASKRHIDLLIENNYIVVIVEEITPSPNTTRAVTNVYSKSTYIDSTKDQPDYNYLSVIVIDEFEQINNNRLLLGVGLSAIDVSTGNCHIYESISTSNDENRAVDETVRFINTFKPNEIVIYNKTRIPNSDLITKFEIYNIQCTIRIPNNTFEKVSYQNEFFDKAFNFNNMLSSIENLNLEFMDLARIALVQLIQFVYDHNETLVDNMKKPIIFDNDKHLILENNAISQLNILENGQMTGKVSCLLNVVNFTSTAIGKRRLKETLLTPITNIELLNKRYSDIDFIITNNHITMFDDILKGILDFERAQSKITMMKMHPHELAKIIPTYDKILKLDEFTRSIEFYNLDCINEYTSYCNHLMNTFNIEELAKYQMNQIETNIFNKGVCSELDDLSNQLQTIEDVLQDICNKLAIGDATIKWESNDRDGYYLTTTKTRWTKISKAFSEQITLDDNSIINTSLFEIKTNKTNVRIDHPKIKDLNYINSTFSTKLKKISYNEYLKQLTHINNIYGSIWQSVTDFIGNIDTLKSAAKCAIKYNYCKPHIIKSQDPFIYSTKSRHPIIERLQNKHVYVTNWICLGQLPDDVKIASDETLPDNTMNGMLLYSCNSTGKSSYMKSIALNVILAQSGHYCAAESFIFSPFTKIMTRILSNDNLFKGLSSFAVEMVELRSILDRANSKTLVVADELANQSEVASGTAIVAASIKKLYDHNVKFVTATHFHQLAKLELLQSLPEVHHYHLKVQYNDSTGVLEYDRTLSKGSGSSIYGLEVARALNIDPSVIALANSIRKDILGISTDFVNTQKSPYNANVFKTECEVCACEGKKNKSVDVHHIQYQMESVNGFNNHIPTNSPQNLVNLCKRHHDQVHKPYRNRQLTIKGRKQTSNGIKLIYEFLKIEK